MIIWKKQSLFIIYMEETVVERNASTQRFLTRLQGVIYALHEKMIANSIQYVLQSGEN